MIELALCKSFEGIDKLPPGEWVMEPKLDGIRLLMHIEKDGIKAYTRTAHDASGKLLAVERAMRDLSGALHDTILDGEAVYLDDEGMADFNFTARIMGSGTNVAQQKQRAARKYVSFIAFDIVRCKGQDLRGFPLRERRKFLEYIVSELESPHIHITEQAPVSVEQHEIFTSKFGEGSVLKDLSAPYKAGRSKAMLKWKKVEEEDVVIMGMDPGKGKYTGQVGAIVFGQYNDGELKERGRCSGMTDAQRLQFTANLPIGEVMVITHNGILAGQGFRHPQFKHIRQDKRPIDCTWT